MARIMDTSTDTRMSTPTNDALRLFRLIQFSDSAFPVGTFSFSNGLETAAHLNLVRDAKTLESYARSAAFQAATSDAVAALWAWRSANAGDYAGILEADQNLYNCRMNDEARLMLRRMGKKLAELAVNLLDKESYFPAWLADIDANKTPGTFPVAQGMAFARLGLSEPELFASHQYGVINMILSAALRCARVSHYDTQKILFTLAGEIDADYDRAKTMRLSDMRSFVPVMDIMSSMHEKGSMRMFMN